LRFHSSCKIFTLCLSSNLVVNYTLTLICILFLLLYDKVSAEPWIASLRGEFGLFEPYCRSWSTCGSHYGFMSFGTRCIRVQDHASNSHWQLTISSSHDLQQEIVLRKVCIILIDWILLLLLWRIMTSRLWTNFSLWIQSSATPVRLSLMPWVIALSLNLQATKVNARLPFWCL
jgi:hypothetical protein